jgi:hypothetical protein
MHRKLVIALSCGSKLIERAGKKEKNEKHDCLGVFKSDR